MFLPANGHFKILLFTNVTISATNVTMKKNSGISEAEWKIMESVWANNPTTSQEIVLSLKDQAGWKPETVKTLISRLVKKGALIYEAVGNRYHYRPAIERSEAVAAETNSFFSRVGRASLGPVLSHFVESKEALSDEEIAALKKLLHAKGGKK